MEFGSFRAWLWSPNLEETESIYCLLHGLCHSLPFPRRDCTSSRLLLTLPNRSIGRRPFTWRNSASKPEYFHLYRRMDLSLTSIVNNSIPRNAWTIYRKNLPRLLEIHPRSSSP